MLYAQIRTFVSKVSSSNQLLDLLRLQSNSLIIHKYSLPLIRLGLPIRPYPGRKLHHNLLLHTLQQHPRRLRRTRFDSHRHPQLNRRREPQFQVQEFLSEIFGANVSLHCGSGGRVFDTGAEPYAYEAEDRRVPFGNAEDVVREVGAGCPPHFTLGADERGLDC